MAKLVPVDFDPFEGAAPEKGAGPRLVPVDFDPFAETTLLPVYGPGSVGGIAPQKSILERYPDQPTEQKGVVLPPDISRLAIENQLQGQPANVPLPERRPVEPTPDVPVAPLLGAGERGFEAEPTSKIVAGTGQQVGRPATAAEQAKSILAGVTVEDLRKGAASEEVRPSTGSTLLGDWGAQQPDVGLERKEERVQDAKIQAAQAEEAADRTRKRAPEIEAQVNAAKELKDANGVPLIDTLRALEKKRDEAYAKGDYKTGMTAQTEIRDFVQQSPKELRLLLGGDIVNAAKDQARAASDSLTKAQVNVAKVEASQPDTQTFGRNAAETALKTAADLTADTIVGAERVIAAPIVATTAITGGDPTKLSKAIDRQSQEIHEKLGGNFKPDIAQIDDLGTKIVSGVTSTGVFALTGGVGRALRISEPLAIAVSGALPQAEAQWQEALSRSQDDPEITEWRKWLSFTTGLGIGSTEALPISRLFERLEKASNGGFTRYIGLMAASGGEEGLQEGIQQVLQNANSIALLKDPNATIDKDVAQNMLIGALTGVGMSGTLGVATDGYRAIADSLSASGKPIPKELQPIVDTAKGMQDVESMPAVPEKDQAPILKGAGFAIDDIADMSPAQRDFLARDAKQQGVTPIDLTEEEAATLTPAAPAVQPSPEQPVEAPGAVPSPPPEAPSARAQALVDQGVDPLEAMKEAGAEPVAAEPVAAEPESNEVLPTDDLDTAYRKITQQERDERRAKRAAEKAGEPIPEPAAPQSEEDQIADLNKKNTNLGIKVEWTKDYVSTLEKELEEARNAKGKKGPEQVAAINQLVEKIAKGKRVLKDYESERKQNQNQLDKIQASKEEARLKEDKAAKRKEIEDSVYRDQKEIDNINENMPKAQARVEELKNVLDKIYDEAPNKFDVGANEDYNAVLEEKNKIEDLIKQGNENLKNLSERIDNNKSQLEGLQEPVTEAEKTKEAPAAVDRIVSRIKNGDWVISGRDANNKRVFQLDPISNTNDALKAVEKLVGEHPNASLGVHRKITPHGMTSVMNKKPTTGYKTLRGFIARLGGIQDENGELSARDVPKNLINENGLNHEYATRLAIDAGFFPDFTETYLTAGGKNNQAPKEMIDRFRDALGRQKFELPKSEEAAQRKKEQKERYLENDYLGDFIDDVEKYLESRKKSLSENDIREAAILLANGEFDDIGTAVDMIHFMNDNELIGNDMEDIDRERWSEILGEDMWDDVRSLMALRQEGELRPENIEPLEMEGELETEPSAAPSAGPAPREGGPARERPKKEKAPEAVSPRVEKPVAGEPEGKINLPPIKYEDVYKRYGSDIEFVPISWLKKLPGNPVFEEKVAKYTKSIPELGLSSPLIINVGRNSRTAELGEGNHRLAALERAGYTHAPARVFVGRNSGENKTGSNFDSDLIPVANEYFKADAAPSEVFKSLEDKTLPVEKPITEEKGAEGKPQLVIPGAEKIGEKEQLEREAAKPLRGAAEQKEPGGMFGPTVGQKDLMDLAKEQPPMPKAVVEGKTPNKEEKAQRDEENIQSDIPPEGIAPPVPDISLADAQAILRGNKIEVKKVGDKFIVSGKTYPHRDLMRKNLGRWDAGEKTWSFNYDPTQNIAAAIKEVDSVTSAARAGGEGAGAVSERDESKRISELRVREDARPDERVADPAAKVSNETKQLISNGLKFGIPQEVVTDQIEDIGMAVNAFEKKKPMFLLANEAGTGKTFVLGGIIRELRNKGVKKFVYVTQNQDLITQIKKDLAPYGIDDVDFVTYSKMDSNPNGGVLIFDEAHNIKNIGEGKGRAVEGQKMMRQAGMTIFASATPFQNPSETEYLSGTGIFGDLGFADWAKAYGSSSRTTRFFNPNTKKEQSVTKIYWVNTAENKKNGAAARQWFMKQGIMTQRAMKIDPNMVDVTFKREKVDEKWVDLYNRVMKAYERALGRFTSEDGESSDNKITGEIMRHRESMVKRILEASKINAAIERAKELLKEGKYVVIFVETKADRTIGRFRRSEHFKDNKLYTFPEMEAMMSEWNQEAAMAKMQNEKAPPRPFAAFIYEIAASMHESGLDTQLPSTADDILSGLGGENNVAVYTGAVAGTTATKNKNDFMAGRKKVLIATMAKGGTGLSLHDTVGNRPTVQLNINLPWAAWQVDQVSARVARYGLKSKAMIEWMFASNIPWESERLVPRVGARMADMGAIVKGIEVKAAEKLLGDFDFEGEMDVKQAQGEGKIKYSAFKADASPQIPDAINRIRESLARMVGDKVALQFYDQIIMEDPDAASASGGTEGGAAAGFYNNASGIIGLALSTESKEAPTDTLYHEVYHVFEDLLTNSENKALDGATDQLKDLVTSFYKMSPEKFDSLSESEKRAYAMGAYGALREQKAAIPAGPVRTIMNKLWNMWQSVVRAVRSILGRKTMDDVFSDIYSGKLKDRLNSTAKEMAKTAGIKYAAPAGPSLPGMAQQRAARVATQPRLPGLPTPQAAAMKYEIDRSVVGSFLSYGLADKFTDMADWQRAIELERGSPLQDSLDVHMAIQLYQDRAIARQDKAWEEEIKPMVDAMKDADVSVDDLGLYAYAKHAFERNEEMQRRDPTRFANGGGSGLTDDEAQDILDQFAADGKLAALEKIAREHLYPMIRKDTAMRYANGLITQDQYNQYTRPRSQGGYDFYVPLTGYAEDESELTGKPRWASGVGKGFPVYGKEYKTAFGRESLALNPVYSTINRRMDGITRSEKQRVDLKLYNLVKANPNPEFAEVVKPGDDYIKKLGADGTVQYVSSTIDRTNPYILTLKIGGKEVYIKFNSENENMARLVKELKSIGNDGNILMKATMAMGRYFSKINTQWVLDFFLVNFPRDLQDALISLYGTKEGLSTAMLSNVAKSAKVIAKYNTGGELTQQDKALLDEWILAGGHLDYGGFRTAEKNAKEIERLLRSNMGEMSMTEKGIDMTKRASMGVLNAIETINDTFDSTVRFAVYLAARQNGLGKDRAAQLSRRATIDFKSGGKLKPVLNALYPFSGAAIAGSRGLYRLWKSKRGRNALISIVLISAFNSLLGSYMSDDDDVDKTKKEFWTKIKPHERNNSIIIPIKVNGRYVRIPIGFYLQPFWVLGDQIAGTTLGQIGPWDAAVNVASAFSSAFNPLGSGSLIHNLWPVQLRGFYETWTNRDWMDSQMHPERPGIPKSSQYYDRTSDISVTIADKLNRMFGGNPYKSSMVDIYPSNIDYWAGYVTGGVGRFAAGSVKGIFDFYEGNETPLEKMPFVRRYVTSTENISDSAYSKLRKQIETERATVSNAWSDINDGKVPTSQRAEAKEVFRQKARELGVTVSGSKVESPAGSLPGLFRETDKRITAIEDRIDKIKSRTDLTPQQKREMSKPLEDSVTKIKNDTRRRVIERQNRMNPTVSPLKQLEMMFK